MIKEDEDYKSEYLFVEKLIELMIEHSDRLCYNLLTIVSHLHYRLDNKMEINLYLEETLIPYIDTAIIYNKSVANQLITMIEIHLKEEIKE
jgi:hypothetical protein